MRRLGGVLAGLGCALALYLGCGSEGAVVHATDGSSSVSAGGAASGGGGASASSGGAGGMGCQPPKTMCGGQCVSCSDACQNGACCGDGKIGGMEACDGNDLGGASCAGLVAPGWVGTVGCTPACKFETKNCATPPTMFAQTVADGSKWTLFDAAVKVTSGARGFEGAAFDGRYLYLVPYANSGYDGLVTRYDAQAGFTDPASWSTFDVTTVSGGAKGFTGGAYDGHYVYFVPDYRGSYHGTLARYDAKAPFTSASSWAVFDLTTVDSGAKGYYGAVFDGQFLYFVPNSNDAGRHGLVARYDTKQAMAPQAWTIFDATTVKAGAKGFEGGAFDGRYVYFAPNDNGAPSGLVTRYDTTLPFKTPASWSTFDVTQVDASAKGFYGAAFDGRYVYLVPGNNGAPHGRVARYDTMGTFEAPASWTIFDTTTVSAAAKGFTGASFDGRFLFFVPFANGAYHGNVVRYDTTQLFNAAASWSAFDLTTLDAGAKGYYGGAFDGRYLYLAPQSNGMQSGLVARFEAKSVSWLPKGWNASFF